MGRSSMTMVQVSPSRRTVTERCAPSSCVTLEDRLRPSLLDETDTELEAELEPDACALADEADVFPGSGLMLSIT